MNDLLFYRKTTEDEGTELWAYDNRAKGAFLATDLHPGLVSGNPTSLTEHDGVLYFIANSPGAPLGVYQINPVNLQQVVSLELIHDVVIDAQLRVDWPAGLQNLTMALELPEGWALVSTLGQGNPWVVGNTIRFAESVPDKISFQYTLSNPNPGVLETPPNVDLHYHLGESESANHWRHLENKEKKFAVFATIEDAPITREPLEGEVGAALFRVTLDRRYSDTVVLSSIIEDGTAIGGMDMAQTAASVFIPPGDTEGVLAVPIFSDGTYEGTETFEVSVRSSGAVGIKGGSAIGRITEPGPVVSATSPTVSEDGEHAEFRVNVSGPVEAGFSIDYETVAGTAQAGTDYQHSTGHLEFSPEQRTQTVTVPLVDDLDLEHHPEFFGLRFSTGESALISEQWLEEQRIDGSLLSP